MNSVERQLGPAAKALLEAAVREAEQHTSAELAVVVRDASSLWSRLGFARSHQQVRAVAEQLFVDKGLSATAERNGVMVYVSLKEHVLVVLGDEGIHARLGTPRWEALVARALSAAKAKGVVTGVCELVLELGQTLGEHFPRAAHDVNELPDAPDLG